MSAIDCPMAWLEPVIWWICGALGYAMSFVGVIGAVALLIGAGMHGLRWLDERMK